MDLVEGGAPLSELLDLASTNRSQLKLSENDCRYILYAMVRALYLLNRDRTLLGHLDTNTIYCFDNGMIKIAGLNIAYTDDYKRQQRNGASDDYKMLSYLSPELLNDETATYTTTTEIW